MREGKSNDHRLTVEIEIKKKKQPTTSIQKRIVAVSSFSKFDPRDRTFGWCTRMTHPFGPLYVCRSTIL